MSDQRQGRTCASCGTANEDDARFCEGCGGSLGRACPACGVEASATARFCRACGAALEDRDRPEPAPARAAARKTVTVMFADLAGSTSFEERVDAETAREVIGRYHELLRSTAERNRAGVTKYIGDGFMAVWGVPEIGPDDAGRAVDAAVELQERFVDLAADVSHAHGVDLALRVAVNTGEVVVGTGDADLVGDAVNVAARLEAECPRGHVVVGGETWRSTRGRHSYDALGQVHVKGRTAPVAVYQWLGRQSEAADSAVFVGRADELGLLGAAFDDAVAARAARLVTVIGDPGVGKSRLAAEFVESRPGARVVAARCDAEQTVALAPIVEILRARDLDADLPVGVPERDRVLSDLEGLAAGVPASVEETFWALRRFVEVLASDEPLIIILDDLHWADTLLVDFVEHLAEWVKDVPVLVVALARPELREARPDLVGWVSEAFHLGGLGPDATAELAAGVLGASRLPQELVSRLPSSTGGNPLFVRELLGMLVHDEVLVADPAGWRLTIDADAITIPPTIQALLASRLERLDARDRRVLEIASVVGTDFSPAAVCALEQRGVDIRASLDRLRRLELAQPTGAYIGDEPVWRFHHVLIRDVAYRRLLKSDRAELHECLAAWVESGGASLAFDAHEMVARHLDYAHRYRLELGVHDEHTAALALRSARGYATSARRALDRDQLVSAGTQAARAAALAAADEALHAELLMVGCEAFLAAGDVAAGAPLVDDLERIAGEELEPWATCYRCQFVVYTDPEQLLEADARLQGAIDEFSRRGDQAGLAKAHQVRAGARARLGRIGDCEVDLFESLVAARQAGDHRRTTAALAAAPNAALWGPSPVPKAGGRCLDVVRMQRMTTATPSLEATSLRCLAVLELLRGRPDKARSMLGDAHQIVAELGLRHGLMETELFAGIIELMGGDPVAAEPHLRAALQGLDALGVGADAGLAAALLARSVLAQGRVDEADRYASESEHLAGHNLKTAIAWRAVRAEILAAQHRHAEAVAMAREAVAVAAGTDLVLDHADACRALGRVLAAAGDAPGAADARRHAEALYAAKEAEGAIARPVEQDAPKTAGAAQSRLAVANRASALSDRALLAMRAGDIDAVAATYQDRHVYEDRRRLAGDPLTGGIRAAAERLHDQYGHVEWRTLAVRGERLQLLWTRWSDDSTNEAAYLHVTEVGDDGRVCYEGRFDEDDFESAYGELERRYYAGEGAAFAEAGAVATAFWTAFNQGDFDRAYGELSAPGMHLENRAPHSVFSDRSTAEVRASVEELNTMVASVRTWHPAMCWLSATCGVTRAEREAVGPDGERYAWARIFAYEIRDGRIVWACQFDADDEEQAFAAAEERVRASSSRLAVGNRASRAMDGLIGAVRARDAAAAVESYAERFAFESRRRLSGEPIEDRATLLAAIEQILAHYTQFEARTLAVRGDHLQLSWSRWSDQAGNETAHLHLVEVDDSGRIAYDGRFDDDDFEGAYRELERRYYAGEGAAFAEAGAAATDFITAVNRGDFDRAFGELSSPGMRWENRSRSGFPDQSAGDLRASFEELNATMGSVRMWLSAVCWLSSARGVTRLEREAVGFAGERYAWTRLHVVEFRDGRIESMCEFEVDDEAAAFAVAEERVRAAASRLAVSNRTSRAMDGLIDALRARDATAAVEFYADRGTSDDRRRFSGDPIGDRAALVAAIDRVLAQYSQFEVHTLAVRGERLQLSRCRWSDEGGNQTTHLRVTEVGDDGRITHVGRYEDDDFESAYRELERRYYAGEGAAYAEAGAVVVDCMTAFNKGDLDHVFGELSAPGMRLENRSRAVFPDLSVAEFRTSVEKLNEMVASVRMWHSAVCWVSPTCGVVRQEREAVGRDGERYVWTHIFAYGVRDGRVEWICHFDPDDEEAAFALAEERIRATRSRLTASNRASRAHNHVFTAMRAQNAHAAVEFYSDRCIHDDRRRLRGGRVDDPAVLLASAERVLLQYKRFEDRTLAVRGERVQLSWSRWSDDAGNESTHLHVVEIGDDGLICYDGRFDEDDFEGAYRELERRYYAGEGAAFAEPGAVTTEAMIAFNQGDYDRSFGELMAPEMRLETRSRSAFPDRSATDLRATSGELKEMVGSVRMWLSAVCWVSPAWSVARFEREAVASEGGELHAWTRIMVGEIRDGRIQSMCTFELDDEEAAFALVEERIRATRSRLTVSNRATRAMDAVFDARNAAAAVAFYADAFTYDDRRRLSGDPINDRAALLAAGERVLAQYKRFEARILAVRGERVQLSRCRWSDAAGNETTHLRVVEVGDDGRITYAGRFDEDDFEGAYRELERRYYAGDGAPFAAAGATLADAIDALNNHDFDRLFGELSLPELRVENRTLSAFPSRSASQLRASLDDLYSMVASVRTWLSAMRWVSPEWCVSRLDREAVGAEAEQYAWTGILVIEICDGRLALLGQFELDDEEAAFAFAEQRART
ncbi:adenylate cyclase [Mycobacterium alsense]|uniref:Adenylate cyclase n=1 Tax=Mycobacterium alsense TaxID=324058 RepID=A0ABD6P0K5_9MYCO|nr:adenylate/guanylate cyclase domain-containing protein [Mycobacterium alsense]OBG34540.1 adenylate cyclase [Mycobacterium alsense]